MAEIEAALAHEAAAGSLQQHVHHQRPTQAYCYPERADYGFLVPAHFPVDDERLDCPVRRGESSQDPSCYDPVWNPEKTICESFAEDLQPLLEIRHPVILVSVPVVTRRGQ